MPTQLDGPLHGARWMVEFHWGPVSPGDHFLRITDQESDVSFLALTWESTPSLDLQPNVNTGSLDEQPWVMLVNRNDHQLFMDLSTGEPHARVEVTVYEEVFLPAGGGTETFQHFRGYLQRVVRNYQGRRDLVRLECVSLKSLMVTPLGLPVNVQCPWTFRDSNCQVVGAAQENGTITAINGAQVTVGGVITASPDRYWEKGFLVVDGLAIGVRIWRSSAPSIFHLMNKAPARWLNENVILVPGCDQTIETCRTRWNNEEHFGGAGFAIPSYQPNYEVVSQ